MIRTPQRMYNRQAVEQWFERLSVDWEACFREDELTAGRRLYRDGEVVSTEVAEDCVIVTFRQDKEDIYAVIEWREGQPDVRVSTNRIQPVRSLAVAGLYELEELIADLLPPVAEETREADTDTAARAAEGGSGRKPSSEPARPLEVTLNATGSGLLLRAFWQGSHSQENTAALPGTMRNEAEREQVIRLTSLLHRSGFQKRPKAHGFFLADGKAIVSFLQNDWPQWHKYFDLQGDNDLQPWMRGRQTVRLRVRIEERDGRIGIHWKQGRKSAPVSNATLGEILRHPGQTHFVPGEGIFRLDPEQEATVSEWKAVADAFYGDDLPPYLLFRFLDHPDIKVDLDQPVADWVRRLTSAEPRAADFPDCLRSYQVTGVDWLNRVLDAGCHPLLADEMGLGKTLQALSLLNTRKALEEGAVLVVCPASVVPVWQEEIARFFPDFRVEVLRGDNFPAAQGDPAIWLSSYTQTRRHRKELEGITFAYLLLDEAQFIKNPEAKTTQACLSLRAHYRIALTGTPVENRPQDLWTLFRFLMPGLLGNRRMLAERMRDEPDKTLKHLRQQLKPFVLRRRKSEVARDLPEKLDVVLPCPLTPMQETLYRQLSEEGIGELRQTAAHTNRMHVFALLTRLRQACCDPSLLPGMRAGIEQSGKLRVLLERLDEALASGSKVIVFSQFVRFLDRARQLMDERFADTPVFELTGKTANRSRPVEAFRKTKGSACFLISLRAGGTGLNLQSADYVFLLDPWWNPAVEAQAVDRVHRLGRTKKAFIYRLISQGTIEERIERLKSEKSSLFDELLSEASEGLQLSDHLDELEEWIRYQSPQPDTIHA